MVILVDIAIGALILSLAGLIFALGLKAVRGDKNKNDGQ